MGGFSIYRTVFAALAALAVAAGAQAEAALRTFVAQRPGPPAKVAVDLSRLIPGAPAPMPIAGGGYLASYAGIGIPTELAVFLSETFPGFEASGQGISPVVLSFAVTPSGEGARISLMTQTAAATPTLLEELFGEALPDGTTTLLSGGTEFVLSLPSSVEDAVVALAVGLAGQGYRVSPSTDAEGTLMLAQARGTAAFVFVQPDPARAEHSIVVVRTLEE